MDLMPPTIVDISIEQVTIEGLGPADRRSMRRALERDLARLVEERGLPDSWIASGARSQVTARMDWDGRGGTDGLSAALAEQIYQGFES
jgi:hypothetical protein